MKSVTLRPLCVFSSVARHLSVARSAEEQSPTPSAVSMQVKELGSRVALPLFDRSSRSAALTAVREYVLTHARKALAVMRDAEGFVARFRGLQTGKLDRGRVSSAECFLPRLLTQFRADPPGIELRLQVDNNREQLTALTKQGDVELVIRSRLPAEWATRAGPFARHPHVRSRRWTTRSPARRG